MTVGIVIVTHGNTGHSLIEVAEFILGQSMDAIRCVRFDQSGNRPTATADLRSTFDQVNSGDGILVLTDLIGASPSNLVAALLAEYGAVMVTGINLAMLISVWNYRNRTLGLLARKAIESGRRGVKIFQE
jgi:PTS system ascorbate-specific IIA component